MSTVHFLFFTSCPHCLEESNTISVGSVSFINHTDVSWLSVNRRGQLDLRVDGGGGVLSFPMSLDVPDFLFCLSSIQVHFNEPMGLPTSACVMGYLQGYGWLRWHLHWKVHPSMGKHGGRLPHWSSWHSLQGSRKSPLASNNVLPIWSGELPRSCKFLEASFPSKSKCTPTEEIAIQGRPSRSWLKSTILNIQVYKIKP